MQDFDIKLAAGEVRIIDAQADYIYYRSGSAGGADAAIEFSPRSGGETIFLYPGQAYRVPSSSRGLGVSWALKNRKGEAPIIGVVILGEGEFQDNRISGSVEVIDGGKARTMAGVAFQGASAGTGSAAEYPHVQLWNPVASGKRLIVKQVTMSSVQAQQVALAFYAVGLVNMVTNPLSKMAGGLPSASELRWGSDAVLRGGNGLIQPYLSANQNLTVLFSEPVVLPPGQGLLTRGGLQASSINVSFEHIEEAI